MFGVGARTRSENGDLLVQRKFFFAKVINPPDPMTDKKLMAL